MGHSVPKIVIPRLARLGSTILSDPVIDRYGVPEGTQDVEIPPLFGRQIP
jgi:hypothetical protein